MLSCEYIASESLHGLIVSEAYKIPNLWIKFQLNDQEMKFHDFFLSIGNDREKAVQITEETSKQTLIDKVKSYKVPNMKLDLKPLIKACPFKIENITYPANIKPATDKIAICCIGKLENNYIREFVEYHKSIGFDNIILYDNNDPDGEHFEDVIKDYIDSGFVILKDYRGKQQAQIQSYTECYTEYQDAYDWIAFIDIDEFIHIDAGISIHEYLNLRKFNINGVNAIKICWKQFTDNNIIKCSDDDYSIKKYTEFLPISNKLASAQTKIILRTSLKNVKFSSPHGPLKDTRINCVNTAGEPCKNDISISNNTWNTASLYHYRFRTIHEYVMNKMVRLWPTNYGNGGKTMLNLDFFFQFNTYSKEKYDYAMNLIKKYNINENKS